MTLQKKEGIDRVTILSNGAINVRYKTYVVDTDITPSPAESTEFDADGKKIKESKPAVRNEVGEPSIIHGSIPKLDPTPQNVQDFIDNSKAK